MMAMIRDDLAALGIEHEVFFSERSLTGADGGADRVEDAIERCAAKGLIYEGRLPPPKGAAGRGLGGPRADAVPLHRSSATTSTGR